MEFSVFVQAPVVEASFPSGTIGGDYLCTLTGSFGDDQSQNTVEPTATFLVTVPDGDTREYQVSVRRLDAAGNPTLGGSLSKTVVLPPLPQPVLIEVVDMSSELTVSVTPTVMSAVKAVKK